MSRAAQIRGAAVVGAFLLLTSGAALALNRQPATFDLRGMPVSKSVGAPDTKVAQKASDQAAKGIIIDNGKPNQAQKGIIVVDGKPGAGAKGIPAVQAPRGGPGTKGIIDDDKIPPPIEVVPAWARDAFGNTGGGGAGGGR